MISRATVVLALSTLSMSSWAGEVAKYGKPLTGLKPAVLADVLAKPEDGQRVRLEGKVGAVCERKGCWIELRQGASAVHVTFEDYAFFLPRDSAGRDAVLEGKVVVKRPDPEDVEHLKSEGAGEAAASRISIEASGVELRKGTQAPLSWNLLTDAQRAKLSDLRRAEAPRGYPPRKGLSRRVRRRIASFAACRG